tara:strand:- start:398 stop:712 length:315 start_codon:yes stop_codon:yes gene_type:complete
MNTEFVIDRENNQLLMTITAEFRHRMSNDHVRIGFSAANRILKEQFECPEDLILGECLTPTASVDNEYLNRCCVTWTFSLISKSPAPVAKKARTRSKKSTTRVK